MHTPACHLQNRNDLIKQKIEHFYIDVWRFFFFVFVVILSLVMTLNLNVDLTLKFSYKPNVISILKSDYIPSLLHRPCACWV
jgi:hypothetical protein